MSSGKEQIGERVLFYRKLKGLTQDQLAESIGIDSKSIGRIERGAFSPSLDTLYGISEALGVDVSKLISYSSSIELDALKLEAISFVMESDSSTLKNLIAYINKTK